MSTKKQNLFFVLFGIFLTNALLAEIIGAKIFSMEKIFSLQPLQIPLFGYSLDLNLTSGVLLWPIVFIVSDIINEYFGQEGVRKISYTTAALILFAFVCIYSSAQLPPADFWMEVNNIDKDGNYLNINNAYGIIFRQGMGIIAGSLTAFLIGQIVDAIIFQQIKKLSGGKYIWLRATGSTVVSQLIDSFVVLLIAFYVFGNWSLSLVLAVGIVNFCYKIIVALLLIPFLYIAHYFIDKYLDKKDLMNDNNLVEAS